MLLIAKRSGLIGVRQLLSTITAARSYFRVVFGRDAASISAAIFSASPSWYKLKWSLPST